MDAYSGFFTAYLIVVALFIAFFSWLYKRILNKAGFSGWWQLLIYVPIVNIVMIWVFAFGRWPALPEREPGTL